MRCRDRLVEVDARDRAIFERRLEDRGASLGAWRRGQHDAVEAPGRQQRVVDALVMVGCGEDEGAVIVGAELGDRAILLPLVQQEFCEVRAKRRRHGVRAKSLGERVDQLGDGGTPYGRDTPYYSRLLRRCPK